MYEIIIYEIIYEIELSLGANTIQHFPKAYHKGFTVNFTIFSGAIFKVILNKSEDRKIIRSRNTKR